MARSRTIRWSIVVRVRALPCEVCGVPFGIQCDHILPFSLGGGNEESNIQPLCRDCNSIKSNRLTNEQISVEIARRGQHHFLYAVYREDTKHESIYGGTDFSRWLARRPDRVSLGRRLHSDFSTKFQAVA